jgi:hypothetical protein
LVSLLHFYFAFEILPTLQLHPMEKGNGTHLPKKLYSIRIKIIVKWPVLPWYIHSGSLTTNKVIAS